MSHAAWSSFKNSHSIQKLSVTSDAFFLFFFFFRTSRSQCYRLKRENVTLDIVHTSFHSDTVLVRQTPTKLIVYYHALELAFSCLQQMYINLLRNVFFVLFHFSFLSAACLVCGLSIHTLIDVASLMFADECCSFFCHWKLLEWCCVYKVLG